MFEDDGIPNWKTPNQSELSCVHASNPSQEEGFGLHILQLQGAIKLKIQMFQTLVFQIANPLQNGRVILGIGVDDSFGLAIEAFLEHFLLDIHDPVEDCEDIRLCMGNAIHGLIFFLDPR